jgi:DNA-binding response OmpR family regulator
MSLNKTDMKVLVIEDDLLMLEAIGYRLKKDGHHVLMAENSFKALNIIEHEDINVIISDIMMPDMSGLELLSLLKRFYLSNVPVILISALFKSIIRTTAIALGAKELLVKPIDFDKLSFYVKKYGK